MKELSEDLVQWCCELPNRFRCIQYVDIRQDALGDDEDIVVISMVKMVGDATTRTYDDFYARYVH